ncbi:cilia- and flagella-associated protein 53 [Pseudonaja textilis]|uniref:cilia- and flagella-associated protein 53 n=1 Tax=Pseudonaja textilis TaxID=8673 RepID=UPI000EAA3C63|nr:cilia- and flagella-associated protein 53 [Pseudonaja textilis]
MMDDRGRVHREVKGHKPYVVAFRAKAPSTAEDSQKQLFYWRAQEAKRHEFARYAKSHHIGIIKGKMEEISERKRHHLEVQKRIGVEMQAYLAGEEERKERLRDLLETEEKGFIAEMESQEETTESRRNSMRMRAKELREKREEARRKLVAEKRELQFRETCEEVRLLLNQQHMKEVCEDRMSQLALKQELNKQKEMEEAMYNALWEEDRLAKEKRASEEANKRSGWREEMISMLNGQRAIAEAQRQETRRLKEEEAKLMEEERQLIKLEKEQAEIERQRKLRECRDMLLDSMKKKAKRLSEERQDELALEMKILDHVLQESLEDTESQKQRKRELFQEQQAYRAYLAQQREEEKRQEEELDRMRAEDAAKMWAKRAEKERALKLARDRLLKEVMDTRKLQIEEKLQRNAKEQEDLLRDKELLKAAIQEYQQLEQETCTRRLQQSKQYREELRGQIDHRKEVREMEKEEERREYALAEEAEKLYHQKLADILSRPYMKLKFVHPLRRQLVVSSKS